MPTAPAAPTPAPPPPDTVLHAPPSDYYVVLTTTQDMVATRRLVAHPLTGHRAYAAQYTFTVPHALAMVHTGPVPLLPPAPGEVWAQPGVESWHAQPRPSPAETHIAQGTLLAATLPQSCANHFYQVTRVEFFAAPDASWPVVHAVQVHQPANPSATRHGPTYVLPYAVALGMRALAAQLLQPAGSPHPHLTAATPARLDQAL